MGVYISGTGSYVPDRILTNAELETMVDTSDEWIRTRTGIEERHLSTPDQATSDLALPAAQRALASAGIRAEELSVIIVASVTPDQAFPNTACILQRGLGAFNAFCFDLSAACCGLTYAMTVADSLLKGNPQLKHALVLGAEKLSGIVDWSDRNTCVLFGDGASAVVLSKDDTTPDAFLGVRLGSDGRHTEILKLPAGGSRLPASVETLAAKQHCIHMAGREVFNLAVGAMVEACRDVLESSNVSKDEIKYLIPHQANQRIIQAIGQRLDIADERVFVNVNCYGNTSAASIGLCLDDMAREGLLERGDKILLTAFGGGLTWSALLLRW